MKEWILLQDARDEGREEGKEEGIEQGIEQGIKQGREEGILFADKRRIAEMLRRGKTEEQIVDFCGYPMELVKQVQEDLLQTV